VLAVAVADSLALSDAVGVCVTISDAVEFKVGLAVFLFDAISLWNSLG
jgi:hypothetical protein